MNVLWISMNTTGLDSESNGILDVSCIIEAGGRVQDSICIKMRLPDSLSYNDDTLKYLEIDKSYITQENGFVTYEEGIQIFENKLSAYVDKYNKDTKFHLAGFNLPFIRGFLEKWYQICNNQYLHSWIYNDKSDIDIFKVYNFMEWVVKAPVLQSHSMNSIAKGLGLPESQSNWNSLQKVELTRNVGLALTRNIWNK
jgi:DNA polymerase-3 subunit epsilon